VTVPDAIKLAQRVEFWRDRLVPLGLTHWRIERVSVVAETPNGQSANASVQPSHTYDSVFFWFKEEFLQEASKRQVDETIIHEWMHVLMRDLDQAVEAVEDELSPASERQWAERIGHEREGLVDRLARTIYLLYVSDANASKTALGRLARSSE